MAGPELKRYSQVTEAAWNEAAYAWIENSETMRSIGERLGISLGTVRLRAKRCNWYARRECARQGIVWSGPAKGNGQAPVVTVPAEDEGNAATRLQRKHSRLYREQADQLFEEVQHVRGLVLGTTDGAELQKLVSARVQLTECYRVVTDHSTPPQVRVSAAAPRRVVSAPIPLD